MDKISKKERENYLSRCQMDAPDVKNIDPLSTVSGIRHLLSDHKNAVQTAPNLAGYMTNTEGGSKVCTQCAALVFGQAIYPPSWVPIVSDEPEADLPCDICSAHVEGTITEIHVDRPQQYEFKINHQTSVSIPGLAQPTTIVIQLKTRKPPLIMGLGSRVDIRVHKTSDYPWKD